MWDEPLRSLWWVGLVQSPICCVPHPTLPYPTLPFPTTSDMVDDKWPWLSSTMSMNRCTDTALTVMWVLMDLSGNRHLFSGNPKSYRLWMTKHIQQWSICPSHWTEKKKASARWSTDWNNSGFRSLLQPGVVWKPDGWCPRIEKWTSANLEWWDLKWSTDRGNGSWDMVDWDGAEQGGFYLDIVDKEPMQNPRTETTPDTGTNMLLLLLLLLPTTSNLLHATVNAPYFQTPVLQYASVCLHFVTSYFPVIKEVPAGAALKSMAIDWQKFLLLKHWSCQHLKLEPLLTLIKKRIINNEI